MLNISETSLANVAQTQVEFLDVLTFAQFFRCIIHDNPPIFHDISMGGYYKGNIGILFHQQDRNLLLLIDYLNRFKKALYQKGSQA
jgi:hypothetical protein